MFCLCCLCWRFGKGTWRSRNTEFGKCYGSEHDLCERPKEPNACLEESKESNMCGETPMDHVQMRWNSEGFACVNYRDLYRKNTQVFEFPSFIV